MAFDPTPTQWLPSWSSDGTNVTFALADLSATLEAAEADPATGDWRDILFSLIAHSYEYVEGLPAADRPSRVTITRATSQINAGTLRRSFTFVFETEVTGEDVTSEPT